jgi:hypothetical protein
MVADFKSKAWILRYQLSEVAQQRERIAELEASISSGTMVPEGTENELESEKAHLAQLEQDLTEVSRVLRLPDDRPRPRLGLSVKQGLVAATTICGLFYAAAVILDIWRPH